VSYNKHQDGLEDASHASLACALAQLRPLTRSYDPHPVHTAGPTDFIIWAQHPILQPLWPSGAHYSHYNDFLPISDQPYQLQLTMYQYVIEMVKLSLQYWKEPFQQLE
jgi:hypothetical protein